MPTRQLYPFKLWSSSQAVAGTSGIVYSPAVQCRDSVGSMAVLVELSAASGTPHVDVYVECSDDDPNGPWYRPVDAALNDLTVIYSDLQATKWIEFSPPLCKYIRVVIDGVTSNSNATLANATIVNQVEL